MSRANRRFKRKQKQKEQQVNQQEVAALQDKMKKAWDAEDYAGAIDTLAKLVQAKSYDPEYLYLGARSYFMMQDYTRAAQMVENTLSFAPGHIEARILLARICVLQNRVDDGLAVLDFVLENSEALLAETQRRELENLLEYYAHNDKEHLCADFPHIASFLHLADDEVPDAELVQPQEKSSAQPEPSNKAEEETQRQLEQIRQQTASVAEKIRICNAFAGAHFTTGDYAGAGQLLKEALALDGQDPETLRNLAVLFHRAGQSEKAMALAAKMPETDFVLLDFLCH